MSFEEAKFEAVCCWGVTSISSEGEVSFSQILRNFLSNLASFLLMYRVRVRVDLWPWHSFYLPCYGASCRLQVGADTPVTFNHVI